MTAPTTTGRAASNNSAAGEGSLPCDVCGYSVGLRFRAAAEGDRVPIWCWRHAHLHYRTVARRALRVAVVVGTILVLINQSGAVLHLHVTAIIATKIALVYLVPFSVASYSALQATRVHEDTGHTASDSISTPSRMASGASDVAGDRENAAREISAHDQQSR